MNTEEQFYLNLLDYTIKAGVDQSDRTGIGTKSLCGAMLRFSLQENTLPLLTTKKMFVRGIIEELLFFIRGETNSKKLEEKGVNIWKGNTSREFLDKRGLSDYPEGEMGPMYGYLWRNFHGVDQLKNCLELIKKDPSSRRIMVTAYDPSLSEKCVLDPCHLFFQFHVQNNKLSLQWYQRSVDMFLGLPFNICSYGILLHLFAKATGLETGDLIFNGGNMHIYNNHISQCEEQMIRVPNSFPKLIIKKEISSIEDMEKLVFEDFEIKDYNPLPAIKAEMAV